MALSGTHDTLEEIPEQYQDLYTEKNGKFELTGITGIKTQGDVTRINTSLTKERAEHKETKAKLGIWGDMVHADVMTQLDTLPELQAAAKGKLDEAQIDEIVNRRVDSTINSKTAPLERENKLLREQNETQGTAINGFESANTSRKIGDALRKTLTKAKVITGAMADAMLYASVFEVREDDGEVVTRENVGVTPGVTPDSWMAEVQDDKRHWFGDSVGGGSRGSRGGGGGGGANPFSGEHWNMTRQGQYVKEHGMEKAEARARAAGTTVGGPRPAAKKG